MMKVLLLCLVLVLVVPVFGGYTNYYTFKIDHTKVAVGSQTNYVFSIIGTYGQFKTAANGGDIQNTTTCCANTETVPADMIFTTTLPAGGTCTKNLDWDIPYYVGTTGAIEVHVGPIASVSSSVDTKIYVCTGNAAVTTYQSTYTTTWPSMFKSVYHFGDLTTLDLHDSTINGNTATNHGATLGTGIAGGGLATDGSSSKYIAVAGMPSGNNLRTVTAFFKTTSTAIAAIFDMGTTTGTGDRWLMFLNTSTPNLLLDMHGGGTDVTVTCFSCEDGNWHQAESHQHDTTGSNCAIVADGTNSNANAFTPNTTATPQLISQSIGGGNGINGTIDEVEIYNVDASSNGYNATRYNNVNSPSTFYSVSSATPVSTGAHGFAYVQ